MVKVLVGNLGYWSLIPQDTHGRRQDLAEVMVPFLPDLDYLIFYRLILLSLYLI